MKKIRTTRADFALFQRECTKWLERLGMTEWRVHFRWEKLEDDFAQVSINEQGHCAEFSLAKDWPANVSRPLGIKSSALHEVIHVMVYDLENLVMERVVTEELKNRIAEALVRRIHHALTDKQTRICGA